MCEKKPRENDLKKWQLHSKSLSRSKRRREKKSKERTVDKRRKTEKRKETTRRREKWTIRERNTHICGKDEKRRKSKVKHRNEMETTNRPLKWLKRKKTQAQSVYSIIFTLDFCFLRMCSFAIVCAVRISDEWPSETLQNTCENAVEYWLERNTRWKLTVAGSHVRAIIGSKHITGKCFKMSKHRFFPSRLHQRARNGQASCLFSGLSTPETRRL